MPEDSEAAVHHCIPVDAVGETEPWLPVTLSRNLKPTACAVQSDDPDTADEIRQRRNLRSDGRRARGVEIAQLIALRHVARLVAVTHTVVQRQLACDLRVIPDIKSGVA